MENNIEGDLIETGVWRGGAVILMDAINKFYNLTLYLALRSKTPPPYGERPPIKSYLFTRIITPYIECPSASHEGH